RRRESSETPFSSSSADDRAPELCEDVAIPNEDLVGIDLGCGSGRPERARGRLRVDASPRLAWPVHQEGRSSTAALVLEPVERGIEVVRAQAAVVRRHRADGDPLARVQGYNRCLPRGRGRARRRAIGFALRQLARQASGQAGDGALLRARTWLWPQL